MDAADFLSCVEVLQDGLVAQGWSFTKNRVLCTIHPVIACEPFNGGSFQRFGAHAVKVRERRVHFQRLIFYSFAAERKESFDQVFGLFPPGRRFRQLAIILPATSLSEQQSCML